MRVYVPKLNKEGVGGGNTFIANYRKKTSHQLVDTIDGAEIMFVANPMWGEREDFAKANELKISIVLKTDNIPEDWNNRGTAIPKLRDFINQAETIIYQSNWAKGKYDEFISSNKLRCPLFHYVIHNGVDTDVFTPSGSNLKIDGSPRILFIKSSRNENKRYPEVMEIFRRYWQTNKKAKLLLVGNFADDYHRYNFGFYNGENYQYLGAVSPEAMPTVYRSADIFLFPAYADCAPNVVLEAMACGVVPIIHPYGGGYEFIDPPQEKYGVDLTEFQGEYKQMVDQALRIDRSAIREHIVSNFNLDKMVKQYDEVLNGKFIQAATN